MAGTIRRHAPATLPERNWLARVVAEGEGRPKTGRSSAPEPEHFPQRCSSAQHKRDTTPLQRMPETPGDGLCQDRGHGVAELHPLVGGRPAENEAVMERLDAGTLAEAQRAHLR